MPYSPPPTQADFLDYLRNIAGINSTVLPDNSPTIPMSFTIAMALVNDQINLVSPDLYTLAVYNLGTSTVINFAPDQTNQVYFKELRTSLGINAWTPGVVSGTSDEGTSTNLENPAFVKDLTIANLQQLKDPFGRAYLATAQSMGTLWGLTS